MLKAAQVAVSGAAFHFDKLYTYAIPPQLQGNIQIGSMVLVPFGRGQGARMGVVMQLCDELPQIKGIKQIYDATPEKACLTKDLLELVLFLKQRTFCTYYDAVKAIIPYGAQYKVEIKDNIPVLKKQLTEQTEKIYYLNKNTVTQKLTQKQQLVQQFLTVNEFANEQDILNACNVTTAVLKTMLKNDVIIQSLQKKQIVYNTKIDGSLNDKINLSDAQQTVYNGISQLINQNEPQVALLHGVTSSGKTLVFLKLLQDVLASGKTALLLVPEIGLTSQMVQRLQDVFGQRVAVQHSALNNTERLEQWQKIQQGYADIVVGTRSAVFAPLKNIGIIIIDEEQEHTYYSEQSPRFLAHDIAKKRAVNNNAVVLLASATPSIETYFEAQNKKYKLFEINERYGEVPLPSVELVDMRQNLLAGNTGFLSARLADEICNNLNNGQQTILLLNRRGYQTVAICKDCAEVIKCDSCSVPMVYHKAKQKLMCHHCGKTISPNPSVCPKCGGELKYTGYGTQRIEEELQTRFAGAKILRMDMDTTMQKNAHTQMLQDFAKGKYNILIGTQMVAKGLDFENVSLVGVIGIDSLLFSQSYKAFENVFSLVTQVVGRSGRSGKVGGRAIIQTLNTEHPVLNLAAKQDYKGFYEQEIMFRKLNLYPPFCSLCIVCFTAEKENNAVNAAILFSKILAKAADTYIDNNPKNIIPIRILGPTPFSVLMVNNKYRYKLTVKCRNGKSFRKVLLQACEKFFAEDISSKVNMYFDFNSDSDM